jgi:CBS domain containing-hemolysin-like protein
VQIVILNGVLSLNEKRVEEIMTPIADCHTLPSDMVLDHEAIDHILLSGFSRIPIHEPGQKDNFIGMLLVKRVSYRCSAKAMVQEGFNQRQGMGPTGVPAINLAIFMDVKS